MRNIPSLPAPVAPYAGPPAKRRTVLSLAQQCLRQPQAGHDGDDRFMHFRCAAGASRYGGDEVSRKDAQKDVGQCRGDHGPATTVTSTRCASQWRSRNCDTAAISRSLLLFKGDILNPVTLEGDGLSTGTVKKRKIAGKAPYIKR